MHVAFLILNHKFCILEGQTLMFEQFLNITSYFYNQTTLTGSSDYLYVSENFFPYEGKITALCLRCATRSNGTSRIIERKSASGVVWFRYNAGLWLKPALRRSHANQRPDFFINSSKQIYGTHTLLTMPLTSIIPYLKNHARFASPYMIKMSNK
jgi:hypothetical protein